MGGNIKLPKPFDSWTTYYGHGGIDYPEPRGTLIPSCGDGIVTFAGYYSDRGGFAVFVDHGSFQTGSYHIDSAKNILVRHGQRVKQGNNLAKVGSLGKFSTGPHLHHEVWVDGRIIAPPDYWKYIDETSYIGKENPADIVEKKENPMQFWIKSTKSGYWYLIGEFSATRYTKHEDAVNVSRALDRNATAVSSANARFLLDEAAERAAKFNQSLADQISKLIADENK